MKIQRKKHTSTGDLHVYMINSRHVEKLRFTARIYVPANRNSTTDYSYPLKKKSVMVVIFVFVKIYCIVRVIIIGYNLNTTHN